jgi:hypothetical protein
MNKENDSDKPARKDPLIDTIRERVNAYITGTPGHDVLSLRELARRIGMSVGGLHKFAGGAMPYTATRRKLLRWYNSLTPSTRAEQKRDGLALLLSDIPEERRGEAERSILQVISGYEALAPAAGTAPPGARRGRKRKVPDPPA